VSPYEGYQDGLEVLVKLSANALPLASFAGNLHIIGYNFERQPHLCYGVLGPNGDLLK